jgi:hypothetical protein
VFLYYVPRTGADYVAPDCLRYAFERRAAVTRRDIMGGPSGGGVGWLIQTDDQPTDRLTYKPDAQTWAPIHDAAKPDQTAETRCWVGRWNDATLSPSSLQRANQIDGHAVELGDGSRWLAAIARGFDVESVGYYSPLPRDLSYDHQTGRWRPNEIAAEYRRFFDLAIEYAAANERAVADEQKTFTFDGIDELAIGALSANYRIGPAELALFPGVYSVAVRKELIDAATDYPTLRDWLQKKTD